MTHAKHPASVQPAEGLAERLAALDEASRAVAAELDVDRVLTVIVERVSELVGARYAALGIADGTGRMERFITTGITPEQRAAIGPVPVGHGLLGLLIMEGRTIRAEDISKHPASVGFPANHPPMTTFLGVPVRVKGESVGNLYLTDKAHGAPFTEDDEHLVEMFAVHAGIAIENARLHDQVQRLAVVEERERIGKDLHDGIIQAIYGVSLSLEMVPDLIGDAAGRAEAEARVDRAIDALNLVIADIRSYILRLRPGERPGGPGRGPRAPGRGARDARGRGPRGGPRRRRAAAARPAAGPPLGPPVHRPRGPVQRRAPRGGEPGGPRPRPRTATTSSCGSRTTAAASTPSAPEPPADDGRHHQGLGNMRDRAVAMGGRLAITQGEPSGTRIIVHVPVTESQP